MTSLDSGSGVWCGGGDTGGITKTQVGSDTGSVSLCHAPGESTRTITANNHGRSWLRRTPRRHIYNDDNPTPTPGEEKRKESNTQTSSQGNKQEHQEKDKPGSNNDTQPSKGHSELRGWKGYCETGNNSWKQGKTLLFSTGGLSWRKGAGRKEIVFSMT